VNRCGHGHLACKFPIKVTVPALDPSRVASCFSQCSIYIAVQHEEKNPKAAADRSESVLALAQKTVSTNREAYTLR
jgi:hypothetical protein